LLYNRTLCTSCGLCIDACPNEALSFDDDNYITVDREKCTACGDCVEACPENALELTGKEISVDELCEELLKDAVFYQTSDGGVTFSGGEPLYQSGFVAQAARRLQKAGIHTALDTAGEVGWGHFEEVLDVIDLVLYDLKTVDRGLHQRLTGRNNDLILANAKMLSMKGIAMHMRLVAVPGLNDSLADLSARMDFIKDLETVEQVDLLPYHRYGAGKYQRLGLEYPLGDLPEHSEEEVEAMRVHLETYGIPVVVGG
jgi:pyruvate formate lyase activating enzyme